MPLKQSSEYDIRTEKGFKEFFEEFYSAMYHYALKIIKDEYISDDIVQDAFITIWSKREEYEFDSPSAFLYTTVRYSCMNHLRAEKRIRTKKTELLHTVPSLVNERLFLIEEEMIRQITHIVELLPEQRKKIIKLHMEGLKQTEIAENLNISVNTVKTQKLKARKFIKAHLKTNVFAILYF